MIDKIEKRIQQLGITKQHLAKKAGMSPSQLSHVLSGERTFKPEQETAIKNYLGI
jgi:transcriptional regulator with XRE-family HTH domain